MPKNVPAIVAPVVSTVETIRNRLASLIASDANVAQAIALQSLARGTRAVSRKATTEGETEAMRANRCAQFDDYSARGKIVAFAIASLANKASVALTEGAIADAIGLPVYKVRPALAIVEARLSDLHNAKFPLVSQIGYVASVEGERNEAKTLHFSRVAPAPARKSVARKGKAKTAPAPVAPTTEGESNA